MDVQHGRWTRLRKVIVGAVLTLGVGVGAALGATPASAQAGAPFEGFVESLDPVSGNVTGWARQGTQWVYLRVVVDGQDARLEVPTGQRADVGNFGFTSGIPAQYLDGQPHTLQVFAQEFAKPASPRVPIPFLDGSTSRTFTITNRAPAGFVDGAAGVGAGWCQDPDTPTTPCNVEWSITRDVPEEGERPNPRESGTAIADRPRADGVPGFEIPIPDAYKDGTYYLSVLAPDTAGNRNVEARLTNSGTGALYTPIPAGNLTGALTQDQARDAREAAREAARDAREAAEDD